MWVGFLWVGREIVPELGSGDEIKLKSLMCTFSRDGFIF